MYPVKPTNTMKIADIFKQYIWITDTLYRTGGLTFQELNERWMKTEMSGGLPITRTTFIRHKEDIENMFGICIECQRKGGYFYYIENNDFMRNNHLQEWMLDSLSISSMLMESSSLQDRIVLENIPMGKEYLQPIINAMKQDHKLLMTYHKFGQELLAQGHDVEVLQPAKFREEMKETLEKMLSRYQIKKEE